MNPQNFSIRYDVQMMAELDFYARSNGNDRTAARYERMARIAADAHALLNSDFTDNEDYAYIQA